MTNTTRDEEQRQEARNTMFSRLADVQRANDPDTECPVCDGTGEADNEIDTCPECNGEGIVSNEDRDAVDPLSIEQKTEITVLMSYGGPSDGFTLTYDQESGELERGEYFFRNWGFSWTESLSYDEAEAVADAYGIYVEPRR